MNRPLPFRGISFAMGCVFALFVVFYANWTENKMREAVAQHARVVSSSLWNLNRATHAEYLAVVAKLYNYETISILDQRGEIFLAASAPPPSWHKKLLVSLKMIPRIKISAPIMYRSERIGTVQAVWNRDTIYVYSYILLVFLLVLIVINFYNRLLKNNLFLEEAIKERTRHLTIEIAERKQAEKSLRENESFLNLIIENIPSIIIIKNAEDLCFIRVNEAGERLLGFPRNHFNGKNNYDLFSKAEADFITEKDKEALSTGKTVDIPEGTILIRGKGPRIFHTKKIPITVENEQTLFLLSISEDITEKKLASEEKKKLESQLRQVQKMEAIGTLTSGISHDFNNILSAIMGYTELCLKASKHDAPLAKKLERVLQASNRAKNLIGRLLAFSRQKEQEHQPVELAPIIKEVAKLLRASVPSTIEIKQEFNTTQDLIMADPTQLHQVLMNLCTNAYHSMQDSGGILTIALSDYFIEQTAVQRHAELGVGAYVRLSVSDTGRGIPRTIIDKIFDPYFTTKPVEEGTGLGLSVVHGIVKDHGGSVKVYSETGMGTTFNVFFPKIEDVCDQDSPKDAALPTGHERILVVDDELFILDITKEALEDLGYVVTKANSGIKALALFRNSPDGFDLLLTDLAMPGMTGIELAAEIRKTKPELPVILCTGFSAQLTEKKARKTGIDAVLKKPIPNTELAVAVRTTLDADRSAHPSFGEGFPQ